MATNLSSSRSRTTTPIRAIISTLSTRTSPSIPSSSQIYEPLVKSVLRHRLIYHIFVYSAVFSWIQTVIWSVWGQGGLRVLGIGDVIVIPFLPSTIFLACMSWAVGALPVVVLRKVYLTATRTSANSPSRTVQAALSKSSTLHAFITYTTSAALATIIHTWIAYANEPNVKGDPRLTIFVKSKKHPYYLNGRFVFLFCSQVTMAYVACLRSIMLDRFVFHWSSSSSPQSHKWPLSIADFLKTSIIVVLFTSFTVPCSAIIFAIARMLLPILHETPVLHLVLRPLTAHFLRGSWTIFLPLRHFSLLFRAWFLCFTTLATWETSEVLFDAFVTQPVSVAHLTADPALVLISGVASPNAMFKYFAYFELKGLATDQSPAASSRRTALFGDQKYTPNLWSRLVREGLILLGQDYQLLLRRGKAPPSAPPPPPAPATAAAPAIPSTPTPLIKKPIYQSKKQSPIRTVVDSFASDGPFSQAVDAGADTVHLPELFKSLEAVVLPPSAKEGEKKIVESAKGFMSRIKETKGVASRVVGRNAPIWAVDIMRRWVEWWTKERVSKVVEGCIPRRALDVVVVEVLSHLTCASLTEDRYGVVQRDIPKILEALLSFLSAIETYHMEIKALYTAPTADQQLTAKESEEKEALRLEVDSAGEILGLVGDGLKDGIARIVRTFGDKLLAFKFPPRTAKKLQGFLDYC